MSAIVPEASGIAIDLPEVGLNVISVRFPLSLLSLSVSASTETVLAATSTSNLVLLSDPS